MLDRIKSSQLESLKVSLVSSHTAFIRDDRGNGWVNGWNERMKRGRDEMQTSQRWRETGKTFFWLPSVSPISALFSFVPLLHRSWFQFLGINLLFNKFFQFIARIYLIWLTDLVFLSSVKTYFVNFLCLLSDQWSCHFHTQWLHGAVFFPALFKGAFRNGKELIALSTLFCFLFFYQCTQVFKLIAIWCANFW